MTVKFTAIFQLATNVSDPNAQPRRIGGWSESWYFPGTSIQAAINESQGIGTFGTGWLGFRAGLLPTGAAIVGQRFQVVNPPGPSQSLSLLYPGSAGLKGDIPQMALLCRVPAANANNIRRMVLRGIPDDRVIEGEFSPSLNYSSALKQFFQELGSWQFRGRDLSQAGTKILTMTAAGAVQTETPHGLNLNDMVRILRTRTADGDLLGGRFQVSTVGPGTNALTLSGGLGEASTGGTIRKDGVVFVTPDVSNISISRIITRRVGRPFIQYRGRRSRRTL